jgi:hypothetical protein
MASIKAISIRQPYAWLICHADEYPDPKRIENRTWRTKRRGLHLIHAGKKFDKAGYDHVLQMRPDLAGMMPKPGQFELGGIVGAVNIVDCISNSSSIWYAGQYAFVMEDPVPLPFFPCRGALSFFSVDDVVPTAIFELLK